jgi:hypothetical protein
VASEQAAGINTAETIRNGRVSGTLVRVRGVYPSLNRAARQVADHILADPERVIRASVSEVAASSRVSDATVVRLARLLGFRGYQDLKISLARDLVSPLDSLVEDLKEGDTPEAVVCSTPPNWAGRLKWCAGPGRSSSSGWAPRPPTQTMPPTSSSAWG